MVPHVPECAGLDQVRSNTAIKSPSGFHQETEGADTREANMATDDVGPTERVRSHVRRILQQFTRHLRERQLYAGENVRQHVHKILAQLGALKEQQRQNPGPAGPDIAVEVDREEEPSSSVNSGEGPP